MLNLVFGRHFGFAKCGGLGRVKGVETTGREMTGTRNKKRLPARKNPLLHNPL